jgi:hypothetical protein
MPNPFADVTTLPGLGDDNTIKNDYAHADKFSTSKASKDAKLKEAFLHLDMDDDTNYSPADWRGPAARYTLTKEPPRFKTRRAGSRYAARYPSLFGDKPILDIPRPTTRCWRLYDANSVRPKRGGWALPASRSGCLLMS